jgi:tetratricopeptide (TPR) repeat protein
VENSETVVRQLKAIKWLLVAIASCIALSAGTMAYISMVAVDAADTLSDSSCGEKSFRDTADELIDKGDLKSAIDLSAGRIKTHPNDPDAYWQRGLAYYLSQEWQKAIDDFNQVERLAPSWKSQFVDPYRTAAQAKLASG